MAAAAVDAPAQIADESAESCESCAKIDGEPNGDAGHETAAETTFQVTVKLPQVPYQTQTIVSTQDQAQDIRQSLIDTPFTYQYTCFHLEHKGKRIQDYVDLGEVKDLNGSSELALLEDPYTEKDARIHIVRIRDVIGAAGDRSDLVQGIDAGVTIQDTLKPPASTEESGHNALSSFDQNSAPDLGILNPPSQDEAPKTIKSLSLSHWHPPPQQLRGKGHLLYLQLTTNEGDQYQITSHVSGFYVNKSSNSKFDPFPRSSPKDFRAHSLLNLISQCSSSFESTFKALLEHRGQRDPLSVFEFTNAIPSSPWLVQRQHAALQHHQSDLSRSQESYLLSGSDQTENLRDWNEEFQSTRELPKETVQDRVFRERVASKLFADYNQAAAQGAVLIARGEVAPLNPTEGEDAQIFVYGNVFYSFGADGVGTFVNDGGDEAARAATGKDVTGVRSVNQLDIQGLSCPGTIVVDYLGKRLVGQSIIPGIFKQREPGEQQIDYGGVEGKDVIAENEAFVPLFQKLSSAFRVKKHPVWDKEGKRHDLEGSIETKGLLGTDGRKYVLDLYRITPLDISWIEQHWTEPPSDGGNDESRAKASYPHRMTVLRPELVEAFWKHKLREYAKSDAVKNATEQNAEKPVPSNAATTEEKPSTETDKTNTGDGTSTNPVKKADDPVEKQKFDMLKDFTFALNPDVFSGQQPRTEAEKEEWAKDEMDVRAACEYLQGDILPRLIEDYDNGEIGFPIDGLSLTTTFHKRGINVRYLGKFADMVNKPLVRYQAMRQIACQEMISRAFKHVANHYLKRLPQPFATACISHLLNCLLGQELNPQPQPEPDLDMKSLYTDSKLEFEELTPLKLQEQIAHQVFLRYRYDLGAEWIKSVKHLQLLREVASKLGLQLLNREYNFAKAGTIEAPSTNGQTTNGASKKKKKGGDRASPVSSTSPNDDHAKQTFCPDDIVNIIPLVKDASPRSVLADEALAAGRISIAQNQKELGQELLLESLSLHEQIYGILHPEVARTFYQLSSLFYGLEDKEVAVELARKACIISERTLGVDSHETLLAYLNLGLFEHAAGNTQAGILYLRHALDLWKIAYGIDHPDSITALNNIAVMLQHLKQFAASRMAFEQSLSVCLKVVPAKSVGVATILFQLAQALALDQDSKAALARMREAYSIFKSELGPSDPNTKEAELWLDQLTANAVNIARHAKDAQARRLRRLNHLSTTRVQLPTRTDAADTGIVRGSTDAIEAAVASAAAGRPVRSPNGLDGLDERSIDELIKYIEGGDARKPTPKKGAANPKKRQQRAPAAT